MLYNVQLTPGTAHVAAREACENVHFCVGERSRAALCCVILFFRRRWRDVVFRHASVFSCEVFSSGNFNVCACDLMCGWVSLNCGKYRGEEYDKILLRRKQIDRFFKNSIDIF